MLMQLQVISLAKPKLKSQHLHKFWWWEPMYVELGIATHVLYSGKRGQARPGADSGAGPGADFIFETRGIVGGYKVLMVAFLV